MLITSDADHLGCVIKSEEHSSFEQLNIRDFIQISDLFIVIYPGKEKNFMIIILAALNF